MNRLAWIAIGSFGLALVAGCGDDTEDTTSGAGPSSGTATGGTGGTAGGTGGESSAAGGAGGQGASGGGGQGGAGGGAGGTPGAGGAGGGMMASCAQIQADYQALAMANEACNGAQICNVLQGHCYMGLGGCWYTLNDTVEQADLDALAAQWQANNCMGPVCDCAPPPLSAKCVAGQCMGS